MLRIKRIIALAFLLVSSFFVVPKELVHEIACHDDSEDVCADPGEYPVVGNEHHHCEILELSLPPYTAAGEIACVADHTANWITALFHAPQLSFELTGGLVIRGPPCLT